MSTVTEALLNMYEKHKKYLVKQIEMHRYLDGEYNKLVPYDGEHAHKAESYALALDNIKSLFGEEEKYCSRISWCEACQMMTTVNSDNPYGTCSCS